MANVLYYEDIQFVDGVKSFFGTGSDLEIFHNGSQAYIENYTGELNFTQHVNDGYMRFKCDDGSGGTATYMFLDGSNERVTVNKDIRIIDSEKLQLGSSGDMNIYHDGSASKIENDTGHLIIRNNATDADIVFQLEDNGSTQVEYIKCDSSLGITTFYKNLYLPDDVQMRIGTGSDLKIFHSSGTSIIDNTIGDLIIKVSQDDGDIIFQSDNGAGAIDTYFRIDGGQLRTEFELATQHLDNVIANFGSSSDLQIYHNGTDSYLLNGTGDLEIINNQDDGDIIFKSDNGSGGNAPYIRIDGGAENINMLKNTVHPDSVGSYWGNANDLQIYHDSNNSYIVDSGDGNMIIAGNQVYITNAAGSEYKAQFTTDGAVNLYYDNSKKFETTNTGATVTGALAVTNINMTGILDISATYPRINLNDTNHEDDWSIINDDGHFKIYNVDDAVDAFKITATNDTTFAGDVTVSGGDITLGGTGRIQGIDTVSAATDAASKAYVDNLTTGVLTYQGTWNADTNSPTLSSGSGTPGYYYIVSVAGSTNLDGITDWQVGDWAVFSDQATDAWQKIDNTAVGNVSGSGVNNRLVLWSGTSTVDSDSDFYVDGDTIYTTNLEASGKVVTTEVESSGALLLDVAGDINIDAGGGDINFKDDGTTFGTLSNSSSDFWIGAGVQDKDIIFRGNDGGSYISALTLDMSAAGAATFNSNITLLSRITFDYGGDHYLESGTDTWNFKNSSGSTALTINHSDQSSKFFGNVTIPSYIYHKDDPSNDTYFGFSGNDTFVVYTAGGSGLNIDSNRNVTLTGNITVGHDLKMPTNGEIDWNAGAVKLIGTADDIKLQGGSLSITGDGSNAATLTESGSGDFEIHAADDLRLNAGGHDIVLKGASNEFGRLTNDAQNFDIRNITADKDIRFKGNNGGSTITALTLDMSAAGAATFNNNISSGGHVYVTDGNKFIAGSGEDLQIYHDGSNSYIDETGTGSLYIKSAGAIRLQSDTGENMIYAVNDGAVNLYHNNVNKLQTTSTGADIDGTLTLDTLAYGGSASTALSFGMNSFSFANASGTIISCNSSRTVSINENLIVSGISSDANVSLSDSDLVLSGDSNIELDTSVSSTQSSGTIIKIGSHMSALVAGNIYYAGNSMGNLYWYGADADSSSTENMIALSLGTDADVDGMLLNGIYHKASHGLTVGEPIYLSTTPMTMTNTAPSGSNDYVRVLGYAIDSNHIYFCPDNTWVKID